MGNGSSNSPAPKAKSKGKPLAGRSSLQHPSANGPALPKQRARQVDEEGTTDIYRVLVDKLKAAGELNEPIIENMSPDWRMGQTMLKDQLIKWTSQDGYMPRLGEVVMFVRTIRKGEIISLDPSTKAFRIANRLTAQWLDQPKWEAGVVTQLPGDEEPADREDIVMESSGKRYNIAYSGFRVEPFPEPGNASKPYTKQHKYISLNQMRPFVYWKECMKGIAETDWHPTINHARAIMASTCLVGRYHFRGKWHDATIFCRGAFVGPELVCPGDLVRLLPSTNEPDTVVTDVLRVSAIKCRLLRLDEASDDDQDEGHPYSVCHHISGAAYTMDPAKSYDSIGKVPIDPENGALPKGLARYGTWYHLTDPTGGKHWEVPLVRVLGRCPEGDVMDDWFDTPPNIAPPNSFKPVNATSLPPPPLSRGLEGTLEARRYSALHDPRIKTDEGRIHFWADTRIEQLDLDSVNDLGVGAKDELRNDKQMTAWRTALRCLDGKKGGLEDYHRVLKEREENKQLRPPDTSKRVVPAMMAPMNDSKEIDEDRGSKRSHSAMESRPPTEVVNLDSDDEDDASSEEDEEQAAASQLVNELAEGGIPDALSVQSSAKKVKV